MKHLADAFLLFVKWPFALFALVITPGCVVTFCQTCQQLLRNGVWKTPFGVGFMVAAILWMILGKSRFVKFWATMDHELTHALFAWLTGVRVLELRSTDGSIEVVDDHTEGHVRIAGGNWLIDLSPYFFPTAPFVIGISTWILAETPSIIAKCMLGAATSYSVASTLREVHPQQSDFSSAGKLFTVLVLPCLNFLTYGFIFANELGGKLGACSYLKAVLSRTFDIIHLN